LQYKHWRGDFFPAALRTTRWLEYYAAHFDTVEINNSFYRLPLAETFAEWRRRVPPSFVYAVKSRSSSRTRAGLGGDVARALSIASPMAAQSRVSRSVPASAAY
jgi:uncharacterized protein YecE (DUF72 family)